MDKPPQFDPEPHPQEPQWQREPSLELLPVKGPVKKIPLPVRPPPPPKPTHGFRNFLLVLLGLALLGAAVYAWYPEASLETAVTQAGLKPRVINDRRNWWLRVYKSDKLMQLWYKDKLVKTYRVSAGPGTPYGAKVRPVSPFELFFRAFVFYYGDKVMENDLRTPEGKYVLRTGFGPSDDTYRFALLSYPDAAHRSRSANPGRDVGVHGMGGPLDWFGRLHTLIWHTRGCIALNNFEIDELAKVAGTGTRVEIRP